jgi:SAM-dependent methyltransferase
VVAIFPGHAAQEVEYALTAAKVEGRVAVVGNLRLARRLASAGRDIVFIAATARGLQRAGVRALAGLPGALPLGDGAVTALVAAGLAEETWEALLAEWCRAVAPGGVVIAVDRGQPAEMGRRALCGGLTAVEQRGAGRTVITTGRWRPL